MVSKDDYLVALSQLGFYKEKQSRTDGSHIRFHHKQYERVITGIDDHKNTKEMKPRVHKDLINAMSLILWLECKDENGNVDFEKVNKLIQKLNNELKSGILKNLKKFKENRPGLLSQIVPKKLLSEVDKVYGDMTEESILNYIQNEKTD